VDILTQLSESLQKGDPAGVSELTRKAADQKMAPKDILDKGLIAGMNVVGQKFKNHEIFLPDVLLAAKAMYAGLDILRPMMEGGDLPAVGTVVIGTVQGDLHDIGKNLVGIMLRGAGFNVIDLGKDVPPDRFVEEAEKNKAQVIGMSALLTTTMPVMEKVVQLAKERGIYEQTRIIVGGAPLSTDYAHKIGAHAYCYDGISAVDCVKGFLGVN